MNAGRRDLLTGTACGVLMAFGSREAAAQQRDAALPNTNRPMPTRSAGDDGRNDFDFYFGRWNVHNRRLRRRLEGCTEWETFAATQQCRPILGGIGNLDDFVTAWGADGGVPFVGMTLRLFNPARREWSIYWASSRSGVLEPPVIGRFENGTGRFLGADEHRGRPVLARFVWSAITPTSAHWEQALSADDGRTWETNWTMRMTRADDAGVAS